MAGFMDFKKALILLLILCAMLLPALCVGGVLQHSCPDCVGLCSHETQCSADPCASFLSSRSDWGHFSSFLNEDLKPLLEVSAATPFPAEAFLRIPSPAAFLPLGRRFAWSRKPLSLSQKLLSLEESDLPLRL